MRHVSLRTRNYKLQITNCKSGDGGYILITLMLMVALLSIAALAVLPEIKQQIQRDREEEMMHRGTQYMRAIQHFYKKNNRYPTRVEELENTNNIRFLRKRYKDPMSRDKETHKEKDFRFLHMQDINLYTGGTNSPGLGLNQGAGGNQPNQSPFSGQPNQGGIGGGLQNKTNVQPPQTNPDDSGEATAPNAGGAGDDSENPGNPNPNQPAPAGVGGALGANPAGGNNPLVMGGGPILGVASASKDKSIREFGDKYKHYNDWLFIYDPTADRGGLLKGPVVPDTNSKGGGMGMPAGTVATQSQGTAGGNQPQPPTPIQQQGPQTPQMPPEQEP